ncbi:MAG: hypothetical protein AB1Z98_35195 [Nannocystaceae bacterium]
MTELVRELVASGTFVDIALVALLIEVVVLVVLGRRPGARLAPADVLAQLAAGGILLVALRCALTGADPLWIPVLLAASLPAHLYDLVRRARAA